MIAPAALLVGVALAFAVTGAVTGNVAVVVAGLPSAFAALVVALREARGQRPTIERKR